MLTRGRLRLDAGSVSVVSDFMDIRHAHGRSHEPSNRLMLSAAPLMPTKFDCL
jgi:hypothetical protein